MPDCAAEDANFPQTTQTEDLSQQIAAQKARLAEQERLLHSARLRFKAYSNASLYAFERRERRAELWHKIVEQPHEKYLDSGHLPDGSNAIVDLVLDPADESKVKFICYEPAENEGHKEAPQIAYSEILADSGHAYLPQQVDPNLLTSIRMPRQAEPYESLQQLISAISTLILRCVALSETDARLLAHFVLSTWLTDRLPVAPYLALVGPPQSGKTTLLRVLHLLCRRSLSAADATAITLLHLCHKLHPTLLIDETSTTDGPATLRRLLRVGNTPGSMVLRHKQAWNVFGAKVVCWRELPDDAALNSRCIILPMQGVNDPALRLPDDPEIVSAAAALQSQLLYYRLANYDKVNARTFELHESLPPRKRELYFALATPCVADKDSKHFLLNYFRDRHSHAYSDDSLSAAEYSVLFALFHVAHLPEHRGHPLTKEIAARANRHLNEEREHLQLQIRRVGAILTSFGFAQRRRTKKGWALPLEGDDQRRLHKIGERYGIDYLRDDMPGFTACLLCPDAPPAAQPVAVGAVTG
jgi:hypothetical protein